MSETIWSEDFILRNPKLAKQAIDFLQEMIRAEEAESERVIAELKRKVEDLEFEMLAMAQRYEE
jgi:hypothetical protein